MFLIGIGIGCMIAAFMLYIITYLFPIFRMVYFDWIALIIMFIPYIITMFRLKNSRCLKQADHLPKWKHLIKYLRRDNETVEVLGERAYPGESFVDVPLLGLIEYLGKDCYYNSGDKKYAWVLENMNFTPDPKYSNLTHVLWSLGFSNSEEVKQVLNGLLPELREKIYHNMEVWDGSHGVKKLTKELKNYDDKTITFKPTILSSEKNHHRQIAEKIDKIKNRGERGGELW